VQRGQVEKGGEENWFEHGVLRTHKHFLTCVHELMKTQSYGGQFRYHRVPALFSRGVNEKKPVLS
jgi:hypothetical protein